jgi:hypothetical protein
MQDSLSRMIVKDSLRHETLLALCRTPLKVMPRQEAFPDFDNNSNRNSINSHFNYLPFMSH